MTRPLTEVSCTASTDDLRPPVDEWTFRRTMSRCPTIAAIIATTGPRGPTGCTATALLSLSMRPPALLVSLASRSRTLRDVIAAGSFAVNILSHAQRELVERFATGDRDERFRGVAHSVHGGVPVLTDAAAAAVCLLDDVVTVLDHTLLVGLVRWSRPHGPRPLVLVDGRPYSTHTEEERT